MSEDLLIDQALEAAATADSGPTYGAPVAITPKQGLVHSVYLAVEAAAKGWGPEADIEKYKRSALNAGIDRSEIDAAVERAKAAE
jgi:hypothetical protein